MSHEPSRPAQPPSIDLDTIEPNALKVVQRLSRHGFDAYLVGGCVRDLLLDLRPKDFDIATSARPRQIKRLFRNSRIIGRRFRLAHIHFGHHVLEVATFRAPPEQEGGDLYIRQDNIFGTAEQDARRRDFTINGLFYDVGRRKVIDHVGGLPDLEARVIRTIGDAGVRIREDPVRILRAARFAGRLGFELAPDLRKAVCDHRQDLVKASPPRVIEELYRLLSSHGSARAFRLLTELGAAQVLLPEADLGSDSIFAALERLDEHTGGHRDGAPQSLLLAVLFWPVVRQPLAETGPCDYERLIQKLTHSVAERMNVARRDAIRARQCLATQVRFAEQPTGRVARRFCRRDFFDEAMTLRRIVGPLRPDQASDPLPHWEELTHHVTASTAPQKAARRRRRRGGRRHRKHTLRTAAGQGTTGESCPPPSEPSSAPSPPSEPTTSPRDSSSGDSSPASA